jgi:predicted nucleic acid-binding protein
MNIILDASSIINLINGDVLQRVATIPGIILCISDGLLETEILDDVQKIMVETMINDGKVVLLESSISLSEYIGLKEKYDLGSGETECIALGRVHGYAICSDDWKARQAAATELGTPNVTGSLFLLKEAVKTSLMTCDEAKKSFQLMKHKGGFLPNISDDYFC